MTVTTKMARVAIVGAGPAGLFAAKELAKKGVDVVLLNRDIKPGGLAEYGIYPDKTRLKDGLRCQFHDLLQLPGISYFGNTPIGHKFPLGLRDLQALGFAAVLVAAGAQGTKRLGLPGEDSRGVYHAKEIVYHYNHLPPYAGCEYPIGKRVVVVGVGNVMTDIVRYLLTLPQVEEITTIARRGLAEVKFDEKELDAIIAHLDGPDFQAEVARIAPVMQQVDQAVDEHAEMIEKIYSFSQQKELPPPWRLRFLYSPVEILADAAGAVRGIRVEDNTLECTAQGVRARGTGRQADLAADTLIFAIGDQVDDELGLPVRGYGFALKDQPQFPVGGDSFELAEEAASMDLSNIFVCGWSRNASQGMVGIARRDGLNAARVVQSFLAGRPEVPPVEVATLESALQRAGYNYVTLEALARLEDVESQRAQAANLVEFKFESNEEMLKVMGLSR